MSRGILKLLGIREYEYEGGTTTVMSDNNFSTKIDPEVKGKLLELIEQSNLTQKDFMTRLVQCYETSQARESLGQVKELDQLRHHVSRIEEIYISFVKGAQDRQEADAARIAQAEAEAQAAKAEAREREKMAAAAIDSANERVQQVEGQAALVREQADRELNEMREALAREMEAREQSARLATLAEQAASAAQIRAVELEEQAGKAVRYREERDELSQKCKTLDEKVNQLQALMDKVRTEAQKELEIQAQRFKEIIDRLKEQHSDDLIRASERAEVEKEKAVLSAQKEFMQEISRLRELLAQCREEKAQLETQLAIMQREKA